MLKLIKENLKVEYLKNIKYRSRFLFVIGIIYLLFIGNVHLFDWDEINFAEAAREMIVTGDYLNVRIDFEPFHEKPPLFIWMQVISMKIFGVSEQSARFPNVLIGIFTIAFLMKIGKKVFDEEFGYLWALAYFGSLLPHFYFKTSIIDPAFNLFMYAGVYYLYMFTTESINYSNTDNKYIYYASIYTALAFLTKGPVGFLLVFMTWAIFWAMNIKSFKLPVKQILIFTVISFLPALIWYAAIFAQQGQGLITEFISYQIRLLTTGDAGHEGPFYYHFIVVFLGCFPASIFIFRAFRKNEDDLSSQKIFKYFNIILLGVVLVIFSLVKTKIIHYSSLSYFPVTFLAAYTMNKILKGKYQIKRSTQIGIGFLGVIFSALFIAFPLVLMNIQSFLPQITDKFTNALLRADVVWYGYEIIVGLIILFSVIVYLIYTKRNEIMKSYYVLYGGVALSIFVFLPIMAPKIETYTQAAPVEFFQGLIGKDVYVHTLGYKSYAPYFYQRKEFRNSKYALKMSGDEYENYLLNGEINKSAYFAAKINNYEDYLKKQPDLQELYRKNGFIFFKREK
jgi:4-amino-4-deoxy-L-arabinose transferase-like glycosyltransferase